MKTGFQKGHKINKGRICSKETRRKIGIGNSKPEISIVCKGCKETLQRKSYLKRVYCSLKCRPTWNKGMKGYRAGKSRPNVMPRGKDHWSWKGGISRDVHSVKTPEYKEWRMAVFTRDNFKCRMANEDCTDKLQAHHILRWADHPKLRFVVNNGIALCIAHHPRKRAEEKRLTPYFKELVSVSKEQY